MDQVRRPVAGMEAAEGEDQFFRQHLRLELAKDVGRIEAEAAVLDPVLDARQMIRHRVFRGGDRRKRRHRRRRQKDEQDGRREADDRQVQEWPPCAGRDVWTLVAGNQSAAEAERDDGGRRTAADEGDADRADRHPAGKGERLDRKRQRGTGQQGSEQKRLEQPAAAKNQPDGDAGEDNGQDERHAPFFPGQRQASGPAAACHSGFVRARGGAVQ